MKNHKLKFFYAKSSGVKPNQKQLRHFVHSEDSQGLWAEIRDLSQGEISANDAIGRKVSIQARIGFNPVLIAKYADLIAVDERGSTYRIKEKPDEFNYSKGDMRISLYLFEDNAIYTGDEYE